MTIPWGVLLLRKSTDKCCPRLHFNRDLCYKSSVLILTYVAYMCYHMSRKPISVVKAVLHRNCTSLKPPDGIQPVNNETWCDWAPFNGSDSNAAQLLGELDSAFLFSYAIAMFASGFLAERANLRYFLSLGMLFSGIFSYLFGIAKTYGIHELTYYIFVQIMAGISQTTGWPGVVTVVSNWCGKGKRGLIFGIWNSHTSIGNILGSLIAAAYVETDWSMSFIMPGLIMGVAGFIIFLFLVVHPNDVGCVPPERETADANKRQYRRLENRVANLETMSCGSSETDDTEILIGEQASLNRNLSSTSEFEVQRRVTERSHLIPQSESERVEKAIGFLGACKIPGVIEFSLSLFFSKLVSYTFLYWLPLYVSVTEPDMGATLSADMSTLFDVGGIIGAIAAGVISDQSNMPATTCVFMLTLACPMAIQESTENSPLLHNESSTRKEAIAFFDAFRIPGVVDVSASHFWFNIVTSTFYSWLPVYISVIEPTIGAKLSGIIATVFSVGCIFGSVTVGVVCDQTKMKATVCVCTSLVAVIMLFVYRFLTESSNIVHVFYLFSLGFFTNCPITILLTVVTYDLGNHRDLNAKTKAMATVSAIIYGTGMIGGGVGPILAGFLIGYGWHYVIIMLTTSTLLGLVFLVRLTWYEIKNIWVSPD